MTLTFLDGPGLDGGIVVLDGVTQPRPTFAFFAICFFDTLAFHFFMATWEASEPGTWWGGYGTPLCSRTQLSRLSFGIFFAMRASYSFGPELPSTLSASVSISGDRHVL
jgi:hypothetical protein